MKKIERHYLKYGTVSIIMLIFIFFLLAKNPKTNQSEINAPVNPVELGDDIRQTKKESYKSESLISFIPNSDNEEMARYVIPPATE